MNPADIERVQNLISLNKIEEAITLLGSLLPDRVELLVIQQKLSDLAEKNDELTTEEQGIERTRIAKAIIGLLEKLQNSNTPSSIPKSINVGLLQAIIIKVKETQKPYYFMAVGLLLIGGTSLFFFYQTTEISIVEKMVSGLFSVLSGVPFNTILKKRDEIVNAKLFIALAQNHASPSDNIVEAYNKFIMKNLA